MTNKIVKLFLHEAQVLISLLLLAFIASAFVPDGSTYTFVWAALTGTLVANATLLVAVFSLQYIDIPDWLAVGTAVLLTFLTIGLILFA